MLRFPHLWQRIFAYSLLLVILSFATGFLLNHRRFQDRTTDFALTLSSEVLAGMEGQSLSQLLPMLNVFNRRNNKLWLEDEDGRFLAGERFNGMSGKEWEPYLAHERRSGKIQLWSTSLESAYFFTRAPLTLEGKTVFFYSAFAPPPGPPLDAMLLQVFMTTALIAGVLSLWMARQVCGPLRRLQKEVSELSELKPLRRVTESGKDEIADVARAINRLVGRLDRYITGMREFVANISHEMRSPLARLTISAALVEEGMAALASGVVGNGDGLDSREKSKAGLAIKHIAAMQEELEHMDRLIGTILQAGKLDLQSEANAPLMAIVSFSRVCENIASRFEQSFERAGLLFSRDITHGIRVKGDETLLKQLVSNLLDNAVKYTRGVDVEVRMTLLKRNGHAFLTVENSYDDMPEELLERIFEPFFRSEQRTGTGVGLGLSLVQKIAVLHKGDVMAVSTDAGICICLQLPRIDEAASGSEAPLQ